MKFVGSFEMVLHFKKFLKRNLGIKMPQVYEEMYRGGSIYRIVICCNTCIKVLKLLYDNSNIYLERKTMPATHEHDKIIELVQSSTLSLLTYQEYY